MTFLLLVSLVRGVSFRFAVASAFKIHMEKEAGFRLGTSLESRRVGNATGDKLNCL